MDPLSFDGYPRIKVQIEQPATGQESTFNSPNTGWTVFAANVPMAIDNASGDERYGDQQIEGIDRWVCGCNYMKGITEKMRLNFTKDGVQYLLDITNIRNVNMQSRWLVIKAKSGVNRG